MGELEKSETFRAKLWHRRRKPLNPTEWVLFAFLVSLAAGILFVVAVALIDFGAVLAIPMILLFVGGLAVRIAGGGRNLLHLLELWRRRPELEVSPVGLVARIPGLTITLPWNDIRAIGPVHEFRPMELPAAIDPETPGPADGQVVTTWATAGFANGVVGTGTATLSARPPRNATGIVNDPDPILDPRSSAPLWGIDLEQFETGWQEGRIGEWVRAHRPDLLV